MAETPEQRTFRENHVAELKLLAYQNRVEEQLFAAEAVVEAARLARERGQRIEPTRLRLAISLLERVISRESLGERAKP